MSHPGLVVSEGSAVFSRVCAAGEPRHARRAALTDLRASRVVGGQAVDTLHISQSKV